MSLSLEQILASSELPREKVDIPEWKGEVWVSVMSAERRDAFDASLPDDKDDRLKNFRARIVAFCLCDEAGKFLADNPVLAISGLSSLSGAVIDRIYDAAARINMLREKDRQEAAKN